MIVAVDFDGTIVEHMYPDIGPEVPGALDALREIQGRMHDIILWTMRSGDRLDEAVSFLRKNGIELFGINENPEQHTWTNSSKAFAHTYIDDAALGCPLQKGVHGRSMVDWDKAMHKLRKHFCW